MAETESVATIIALTMGIGWASGINLYAAILTLGLLQHFGHINLPPDLQVVADPLVIGAAGFMYVVEFVADKTPGVDTGWDVLHSLIRIPAGAALAAAAVGDVSPAVQLAAGLVGGSLAAGSHGLKTGTRALINTSPEPLSNWTASFAEDAAVIGGLWVALTYPVVFLIALALFVALTIWLLPKIARALTRVAQAVRRFITGEPRAENPRRPRLTPPS